MKYKLNKIGILQIILFALVMMGCAKFIEPDFDNTYTGVSLENPFKAEGLLIKSYAYLPNNWDQSDVATDNAVSNLSSMNYTIAATGGLTSSYNPFGSWETNYYGIQYANLFLTYVDKVVWDDDANKNKAYADRLKGEALALRVYYYVQLLKQYGGYDSQGNLLGFVMVKENVDLFNTDWKTLDRAPYSECVAEILKDIELALQLLPSRYVDGDDSDQNDVIGDDQTGRINGRCLMMLKAQMLLTAASPAFSEKSGVTWEQAATAAAAIVNEVGGLNNMTNARTTFYNFTAANKIDSDVIWRRVIEKNATLEKDNYPNSLKGNGRINPTHNLVEAFPAKNGYPISMTESNVISSDPYVNRDPRLQAYVVYNGAKLGKTNDIIYTNVDNAIDGVDAVPNKTTKTGYYLRKFLNEKVVDLHPKEIKSDHIFVLMRCTEAYLMYAESANEAWGPQGKGNNSFSAYDIIKKIRQTAGIDIDDLYLESIKNDKDAMRVLIRNERRIELCFEGKRFWDVRRWKDISSMKDTPKRTLDGGLTQDAVFVEPRTYQDYMIYLPLPEQEINKGLTQNASW